MSWSTPHAQRQLHLYQSYRCLQNKRPIQKHTLRLSNPFPPKINVDEVNMEVGRHAKQTPDFVKHSARFLFNFELRGRGGEDDIMILPSRTGVWFANICSIYIYIYIYVYYTYNMYTLYIYIYVHTHHDPTFSDGCLFYT